MLCSDNLIKLITYSDLSFFINLACSLKCYSSTAQQPQSGTIGKVREKRSAFLFGLSVLVSSLFVSYGIADAIYYPRPFFSKLNSFAGPKDEFELQECTTGMCGANACNECISTYTSLGDSYSCGNLVNATAAGITTTQDGCTMVSDEVNQKIVVNAVKKLESQKKQSPEMADQIDQEIEQIKNSKIKKICSCSSDGCNDPQ